ncbi:MAG: sulfatase-like hydrolase/transferase [Phycisphaerae bacterium]|nr:sulfatase-like hydrolase/transferase [Phycisphaerae bacterium]
MISTKRILDCGFKRCVGLVFSALCFTLAGGDCIAEKAIASGKPNIVLIMADDLGYECIGANGGTSYETPVLDQLAKTGVRFEHCYAQPLCTPSRVKIMTGIYNVRNYVKFGVLDRGQTTFAHFLKDSGYKTCIAGKWQLGSEMDSPQHFGFDESCLWQHTRKAKDAKKRDTRYLNPNLEINGKPVDYTNGEYGPDVVSDFICDFMERNKDKPFFAYYPMILTHSPFVPTPDSKNPKSNNPQNNFVDMVAYVDKVVGKITAKLDDLGIRDNTLILFTGDNGTAGAIKSELNGRQVRGGKDEMTDAGTRVPLIASWPGTITEGAVLNDLVDFSDFLPTLCDAAGVEVPHELDIDGRSFLPQLKGQNGNPREWIYCWFARKSGTPAVEEWARNRRYKLYRTGEFYDISKDELEKSPLKDLSPEAQQVRVMLQKALDQYKDARPAEYSAPGSVNKKGKQSSEKSELIANLEAGNSKISNVSLSGQKPNIIFILADDLGYGDCGVYNPQSKIKTPYIDQLAIEGLLFTDAHSAGSTCTPSRYGLLTGINPARTGVLNTLLQKGDPIITEDETTIASLLKDHGYTTKMIGKWHLGFQMDAKRQYDFSKPLVGGPLDRGFESFYGIPSSPGAKPLFYIRGREAVNLPTGREMAAPGFVQEEVSPSFCREAIEIIREHAASKETKPLFLYYASPVPHQPWVPTKAFKGKSKLGDYGDFVMQLDDEVGQINNALKETGLDKNTILIFASDNGPSPPAVREMSNFGHASAGVLRGMKAQSWEGGHRIPFIVKWPGRIAANTKTAAVINFTDLFATLAELMEVDMAKDYPGGAKDSYSFLSVLSDPPQTHKRQAMMFHRGAVRDGDWKLVSKQGTREIETLKLSQFELFNLAKDLSEKNDLSKTDLERTEHLFEGFKRYIENRKLK